MKRSIIVLLLVLITWAGKCQQESNMPKFIEEIAGKSWVHSYEDQANAGEGVECYRENTYAFPPSRGRKGFMIDKDGTFWEHAIAATDGTQKKKGTWKLAGENTISVAVEGNEYTLQWQGLEQGILRIKRS